MGTCSRYPLFQQFHQCVSLYMKLKHAINGWKNIHIQLQLFFKFPLTEDHLQRRRRLRRVAIPNSQALSLLGRDLREAHLQVLLGGGGYRSNNATVSSAASDPFLSSLILNFPTSEAEEISKSVGTSADETSAKNGAQTHIWKSRYCFRFLFIVLKRFYRIIDFFRLLALGFPYLFSLICIRRIFTIQLQTIKSLPLEKI